MVVEASPIYSGQLNYFRPLTSLGVFDGTSPLMTILLSSSYYFIVSVGPAGISKAIENFTTNILSFQNHLQSNNGLVVMVFDRTSMLFATPGHLVLLSFGTAF